MDVLRNFLDDSGSPDGNNFVTVGGYVAGAAQWEDFEQAWLAALTEAEIPYMHMREFGGNTQPFYAALRQNPIKHMNFMLDAVQAIADNLALFVHATVKMPDLRSFNAQHGLALDPYALAIYGCICMLRRSFFGDMPFDLIVDRFEKSDSRVVLGLEYARTDVWHDLKVDKVTPIPLLDDQTFKNVRPLQAADFGAWETRKWFEDRNDFAYTLSDKARGREHMRDSYLKWIAEKEALSDKPVRERKSYAALRKALGILPHGILYDEHNLKRPFELFFLVGDASLLRRFLEALVLLFGCEFRLFALGHEPS